MKIVEQPDLLENIELKNELLEMIRKGSIFIHPTDTVYGLGCSLEFPESIKKIYQLKQRPENKPLSIVAPTKEWIYQNFLVSEANKALIEQLLPGPYSIVLIAKTKFPITVVKDGSISIRIPKNSVTDLISGEGIIFTTTSLNISEKDIITKLEDIPDAIKQGVDIAIDAGTLRSEPSRIFDLTTDTIQILRP